MYTSAELAAVLPWLARLSLDSLVIEPVGLRSVYEQIHPPGRLAFESESPIPQASDSSPSIVSAPDLDASRGADPRLPK